MYFKPESAKLTNGARSLSNDIRSEFHDTIDTLIDAEKMAGFAIQTDKTFAKKLLFNLIRIIIQYLDEKEQIGWK